MNIKNGIYGPGVTLAPGQIGLANEGAFENTFFSQPVTNFIAADDPNKGLQELLDYLAPPVKSARRFEYRVVPSESVLAVEENDTDIRAIGGSFRMVEAKGQIENGKTLSKGLTMAVDIDELKENSMAVEEAAANLQRRLIIMDIFRALAIFRANATKVQKVWGSAVSGVWADPDADLMAAFSDTERNARANRSVFGPNVQAQRFRALRAGGAGTSPTALFTLQQLADLVTLDNIRAVTERYYDEGGVSRGLIPAGDVYGFYAQNGGGRYDPSNLKTFTTDGWRVFQRELESVVLVTVSHYSNIVCTDKNGLVWMEIV